MIDTLEITKNLHKAGFPTKQSDALAKEFYKNTEAHFAKLATKEQLDARFDVLNAKLNIILVLLPIIAGIIIAAFEYLPK